MSVPRAQCTARQSERHHTEHQQVCAAPEPGVEASTIQDNLAADHARLDVTEPHVLRLAAEVVSILHAGLLGRASTLCGDRRPDYRRGQCIGRERWTEVDLAWLCLHAPRVMRAALLPLTAACGEPLSLADDGPRGVSEELAAAGKLLSESLASAISAEKDGLIDDGEYRDLRDGLARLMTELQGAVAQLDEHAPWKRAVAARVRQHRSGARRG